MAHSASMRLTRKKFVLIFLAVGYVFDVSTTLLLNQKLDALWGSTNQAPWQRLISTILSPIKIVLVGPIVWLQQDPDPPPPFRLVLCAAYWSLLALSVHYLLTRRRTRL